MVGLKPFRFAPETSMISEGMCISFRPIQTYAHDCILGDYADMEVIDLSAFPFTSSGEVASPFGPREQIAHNTIRRAFKTLRETGFISIKGHDLTPQEIHRQFDIGKMLFDEVTEEEKMSLHAKIWEGEWAGYKVTLLVHSLILVLRSHSHAGTTSDRMAEKILMKCVMMVIVGLPSY